MIITAMVRLGYKLEGICNRLRDSSLRLSMRTVHAELSLRPSPRVSNVLDDEDLGRSHAACLWAQTLTRESIHHITADTAHSLVAPQLRVFRFQKELKIIGSSGVLQAFSSRLWLLWPLGLWTMQLLDSQPLLHAQSHSKTPLYVSCMLISSIPFYIRYSFS